MVRFLQLAWPARMLMLVAAELLMLAAAWWAIARMAGSPPRAGMAAGLLLGAALGSYYFDLYEPTVLQRWRATAARLLQALGAGALGMAIWILCGGVTIGRGELLCDLLAAGALLAITHRLFAHYLCPRELGLPGAGDGALVEPLTGRVWLSAVAGSETWATPRWLHVYKRAFSCSAATAALALTAPLMALLALAIRCESHGPAIFRQRRVGYGGREFTLYKFRSMRADADPPDTAPPARPGDRRCTRLGRWLRRSRLDELPQLWNVLRGDMDLVGPRPFVTTQEWELARAIPHYSLRWRARPGLTGWAQVRAGYCASEQENRTKLAYDLFYLKHMSVGLDWLILLETSKTLLLGRGAR